MELNFLIMITSSDTYDWLMESIGISLGGIQFVESFCIASEITHTQVYARMSRIVIYGTLAVEFLVSFIRWYPDRCLWAMLNVA